MLASTSHRAADELELGHGEHGKPCLSGGPEFNLSHSEENLVLAIDGHRRLGVDIEDIHTGRDWRGMAALCFSDTERDRLATHRDEVELARSFLRMWTRKEALLKGLGTGLRAGHSVCDGAIGRAASSDFIASSSDMPYPAPWNVIDLDLGDDTIGALATEGGSEKTIDIRVLDRSELDALKHQNRLHQRRLTHRPGQPVMAEFRLPKRI